MARPSRADSFAVFNDPSIPTPESTLHDGELYDGVKSGGTQEGTPTDEDALLADTETSGDDRRRSRHSTVSSIPTSTASTEDERSFYPTPNNGIPIIRPSFRRPESVKRMQMASPPPFGQRTPRPGSTFLDYQHPHARSSRPGTPRSAKSRGSPQRRNRVQSAESSSGSGSEVDVSRYPLILLHISILSANTSLPWKDEVMKDILSPHTWENLIMLRSKVTNLVLQRGILVPHPREEYELLEERLLEALELKPERVTKDGHFQAQHQSRYSESSLDSGMGSSVQSLIAESEDEGTRCETCHHHGKHSAGNGRWSIKVYAANGLMKAAAWSAAWSEMERVDVEILPRIEEDVRRRLDERQRETVVLERESLATSVVSGSALGIENAKSFAEPVGVSGQKVLPKRPIPFLDDPSDVLKPNGPTPSVPSTEVAHDLPKVYKPTQIPLSLLLKNYITLQIQKQDWKNVVIVLLILASVFLALRPVPIVLPPMGGVDTMVGVERGFGKMGMDMPMSSFAENTSSPKTTLESGGMEDNGTDDGVLEQSLRHSTSDGIEEDVGEANEFSIAISEILTSVVGDIEERITDSSETASASTNNTPVSQTPNLDEVPESSAKTSNSSPKGLGGLTLMTELSLAADEIENAAPELEA